MPNSPKITVQELQVRQGIPQFATTTAAILYMSSRGPVNEIIAISEANELADLFGAPTDNDYDFFFTANHYLREGNSLLVYRTENGDVECSGVTIVDASGSSSSSSSYSSSLSSSSQSSSSTPLTGQSGTVLAYENTKKVSQYPLTYGEITNDETYVAGDDEIMHIFAVGPGGFYDDVQASIVNGTDHTVLRQIQSEYSLAVTDQQKEIVAKVFYGQTITPSSFAGDEDFAQGVVDAAAESGTLSSSNLKDDIIDISGLDINSTTLNLYLGFETPPQSDKEFGLVVRTSTEVLERYVLSTNPKSQDRSGISNFAVTKVNDNSNYIRLFLRSTLEEVGTGFNVPSFGFFNLSGASSLSTDPSDLSSEFILGLQKFKDPDKVLVDMFLDGGLPLEVKQEVVSICDTRGECDALLSVPKTLIVDSFGKKLPRALQNVKSYKEQTLNITSRHGILDAEVYKIFDPYNQKSRYIHSSGITASVRTFADKNSNPWFAAAGADNGIVSGIQEIILSPSEAEADILSNAGINYTRTINGVGISRWDDLTLDLPDSLFLEGNVGRLFNTLKRQIKASVQPALHAPFDRINKQRVIDLIVPILKDVTARRALDSDDPFDVRLIESDVNDVQRRIEVSILLRPVGFTREILLKLVAVGPTVSFDEAGLLTAQ